MHIPGGADGCAQATSVLTSESTESIKFFDESESSQWEVMTDIPGRIDFPSRKTLHGHLSDNWPTAVHVNLLFVEVNHFGLKNQETNVCNK